MGACRKSLLTGGDPSKLNVDIGLQSPSTKLRSGSIGQLECPSWGHRGSLLLRATEGWKNEGAEDVGGGKCQVKILEWSFIHPT